MDIPYFVKSFAEALRRIIGLLAIAAALAGCSAVKLGYNNLDDIAYWWLDSYVDFSDEQSTRVREDLTRLHAWHRAQELPPLIGVLRDMEQLAPGDVTSAQACAVVQKVRERLSAAADRAEPAAVTMAMGLTPEQLLHLQRKHEKNDAEFRKQWIRPPPGEQKEKRFDQFLERSEMLYGKLEEVQRAAIRQVVEQSAFDPGQALAERRRRQQDILQTLKKLTASPLAMVDARTLMRGLFERAQEPADPEARRYQQALIDQGCRNMSTLHNSTTPAQRESAVRRLRAYQQDLRDLMARQ
ncbi:MAG: DUF6279 family lipoprotein [Ramlibacter sp.]